MSIVESNKLSMRDSYVDFLRSIALISIILVHTHIPRLLYVINLFNVPLIVMVSGLVASNSGNRRYTEYVISRIKRLVIPTWIFITGFLLFLYLLTRAGIISFFHFNFNSIFSSYCLLDSESGGIGFVWIIRVFLLTMIVTPFVSRIIMEQKRYVFFIYIVLLLLQVLLFIPVNLIHDSILYKQFFLYFTGYQLFIWFGMKLKLLSNKRLYIITIILFVSSILLFIYRVEYCNLTIHQIEFKAPPYLDYQIYGMAISAFLWCMKNKLLLISKNRLSKFIGSNTMWIYFWHIPIVITFNSILKNYHWSLVFFLTLFLSCLLYYIQYRIVISSNNKFAKKYLIG